MTPTEQLPDPQSLGYEAARDELVRIVQTLESGQAPLEDTLTLWERGEALAARCSQILDSCSSSSRICSFNTLFLIIFFTW